MQIEEHQEHLLDIMDSMPDDACSDWKDSLAYAIDIMRKYQKLQSDYENRLKAGFEPTLDKIRAELIQSIQNGTLKIESGNEKLFHILDKYEEENNEDQSDGCMCYSCKKIITNGKIFPLKDNPKKGLCFKCY